MKTLIKITVFLVGIGIMALWGFVHFWGVYDTFIGAGMALIMIIYAFVSAKILSKLE